RDGCNNMSVQQVWSIYLSQAPALQSPQRGIVEQEQEPEQEQEQGRGRGDPMAMPRYLAYAYLKRLGFIVIRPGTYIPEAERRVGRHSNPPMLSPETRIVSRLIPAMVNWWSSLWSSVFGIWERRLGTVLVGVGLRLGSMWASRSNRPLVANNVQLHYDQILQRLQIIPSMRLVQRPSVGREDAVVAVTNLGSSSTESKDADTMKRRDSIVDFEVYKPAGAFKKRQPGPPDYRVVVTSPNTSLPTLDELRVLMHGQSDPDQEMPSNAASTASEKGKKKKAPDWPNVLFAVVDGGQVSFMNISNIKVIP
ncbi:tRNA-splicing endonuclease subunit sen54, partial [Dissophora globulifera]